MPIPLHFQVNQQTHRVDCNPGTSLLSLLRELGYVGVHRVCETGDCGSCTVWLDDQPIHSCIFPGVRVNDRAVTTIEGLAATDLAPMQQAFIERQGFQCGYCTPGMIMSAAKIEYETEAQLREALDGNFCRCTGYSAIIASITQQNQSCTPVVAETRPTETGQIGQSIPKQDGIDIVTGKPVYTADWTPPGLLHLKVLRSPYPHARLRHINPDKAESLPGVHAVFTHADVPRIAYSTAGHGEPVPDPLDHYLLDHKVRFVGDRVAAVVADSPEIAEAACQLIEVEYEILPHVIDPMAAMAGEVILHDEPESGQIFDAKHNIAGRVVLQEGDREAAFADADLVVENTYQVPAVQHVHLEPHVSISWLEADGTLVVRSSTQVPFHAQRLLSQLFDLPKAKVRVYKAKIGGGFGNKQEILTEDLCVLATLRTGRPVKWEFTREEEFTATNSRHGMTIDLKTGVKADGTLVAQEMKAVSNTGAYGNHAETVIFLTGCFPLGLYRCPDQFFEGTAVYTNTMPAGAFRGYGATQGTFAVESQMDEIAQKLGIDPLELRKRNLIAAEEELLIGREEHFHIVGSYALSECIEKVTEALGYELDQPPVIDGHRRRSVGWAVSMQGSGLARIHSACVNISLQPDGRYVLKTGAVDVGTGSDTTLRQIAAHVLGTTVKQIDLVTADTHHTPFDSGSYASATAFISGQAVNLAAQKLRSHLLATAASLLETDADALKLTATGIKSSSSGMTLPELVQWKGEAIEVELEHSSDHSSLTFAVLGIEVEVDTETGRIRVLRCVEAIDIGRALNPRICHGQATGGIAMGLGYALSEELRFDQQGQITNGALRTYRIPIARDLPPMEIILVEKADPYGPFGAKGIGEIGTNCTAPAIVNAVAHATGVRFYQLPMTPERVWQALGEGEARKACGGKGEIIS